MNDQISTQMAEEHTELLPFQTKPKSDETTETYFQTKEDGVQAEPQETVSSN